jgi:mRNA-decapping enzyme subunit 2
MSLAIACLQELSNWSRVFYQLEQGWFFYLDFYADVPASSLPKLHLKGFCQAVFAHCSFLQPHRSKFEQLFAQFQDYLSEVPVCGCILLNPSMTRCLMVRSWNAKTWSFPRGKINKDEARPLCSPSRSPPPAPLGLS